jgi:predicted nucleic acid-binding protein
MIVVDASALLEVLLRTPAAETVEERLFEERQTLHAPHLLDVEVAQVLRRYTHAGEIDEGRGNEALADLADFPIRRYPHGLLLARVWSFRHNFTAMTPSTSLWRKRSMPDCSHVTSAWLPQLVVTLMSSSHERAARWDSGDGTGQCWMPAPLAWEWRREIDWHPTFSRGVSNSW